MRFFYLVGRRRRLQNEQIGILSLSNPKYLIISHQRRRRLISRRSLEEEAAEDGRRGGKMKEDCCVLCVSAARQSIAVAISLGVRPDRPDLKRLIKSSCVSWSRRMRSSDSVSAGAALKSVFCFLLTQTLHHRERRQRKHTRTLLLLSNLVTSTGTAATKRTFRDASAET